MKRTIMGRSAPAILFLTTLLLLAVTPAQGGERNAASMIELGRGQLRRGEYEQAARSFQWAVRRAPDNAAGYAGAGRAYLRLGSNEYMSNPMLLEKGVASLEKALAIDPTLAEARLDLGHAWLALGSRERAAREQKLLEKSDPILAAELAAAIASFKPTPTYRPFASAGTSENGTTRVRIQRNAVLVPVSLALGDRSTQVTLLLDTGASMTIITPAVASRLGIRLDQAPRGRFQVVGGGTVEARAVRLDRLTAGPHSRTGMVVAVVEHQGKQAAFDGLLGMDFLRNLRYHVDFRNSVISWNP